MWRQRQPKLGCNLLRFRLCSALEPVVLMGYANRPKVGYSQLSLGFARNERYQGPDYAANWDGSSDSRNRIIAFCDSIV